MSDLISRKALLEEMNAYKFDTVNDVARRTEHAVKAHMFDLVEHQHTAFDLESVIMELEGISKDMQSEANNLASIGDYGCATKFEGMAQAYKDCVNILKSAVNAMNGKNGG